MKKIAEAAEIIGITKQALYKKVKKPPYAQYTKSVNGGLHLSNEGIDLISEEISKLESTSSQPVDYWRNQVESRDIEIETLKNRVNQLTNQFTKNLETLENTRVEQFNQMSKLLEQQQILALNYQNKIKELEQMKDTDNVESFQKTQKKLTWIERVMGVTK